ncbi:MAG: monofunctional biosynthetic peptidoglycan transglycosylase [Deltaproteobacteria bacterium]|nr:monofunctional biosynthetic peptidoglycan transglycosylase [Deltaproteobacteria bacterium]
MARAKRNAGPREKGPRKGRPALRIAAVGAGLLLVASISAWILWRSLPDVAPLATRTPASTALMEQRRAEAAREGKAFRPDYRPVSFDRISPRLVRAVVASEDASFFGHAGFDWEEIKNAAEQNWKAGRTVRGASTITQQLAKNLWLGTERSYLRKLREALLAVKLERSLPKRRILTLYLDVAEWGNGVFGAEAAAHRWFGTSARDLSAAQAATLAAMLPAPRRAAVAPAPRWLARRARRILGLMERNGSVPAAEVASARAELERILAAPAALPGEPEEEPPEER